jgi:RNA polymerase-binding transcription factor DksA
MKNSKNQSPLVFETSSEGTTHSSKTRYSDEELSMFKELIIGKISQSKREYRELTGIDYDDDPKDQGDKGNLAMYLESNRALAERQSSFIQSLEAALYRIENKTYGICRDTGTLIPKERLLIVPHATLCMEAKNKNH